MCFLYEDNDTALKILNKEIRVEYESVGDVFVDATIEQQQICKSRL